VIHDYRETTISSLPPSTSHPNLPRLLNRAFALLPGSPQIDQEVLPPSTITHLLHLAPSGRILGHVDNLEASGSVIMGVCLGADRILRLSRKTGAGVEGWDVLLQNGTAYLQKCAADRDETLMAGIS
jgi:alkylated DNA repair protein alkB family protein 7